MLACLSTVLSMAVCSAPRLAIAQEYRPPQRGTPGQREGTGAHGTCLQGPKLLMPLTPSDNFSATVSGSPTFFWYVPRTTAQTAEFALLDSNDQTLYKTIIKLPNTPGIVSFSLPTNVTSSVLTVGEDFYWQLSLLCNPSQPSVNPFVEGVVQRMKLSAALASQLKKASVRDRPALYATAGIWQDAIATLAQQRCATPKDPRLVENWSRLLQSVQLEDFAKEPLQFCLAVPQR